MTWHDEHHWHTLSTDAVTSTLDSDPHHGITSREADHRLREIGPNVLPRRKGPNAFIRFMEQFHHPLIYVLLAAGFITLFLLQHAVDAAVIFGVVLVNAIVGFLQESRAKAAIESLIKLVTVETTVIRDGKSQRLEASQLVPGDLVLLGSGDRVPADIRLLRLRDLRVDESMLTGESLPVAKEIEALSPETLLADRKNMTYSGTLVTFGQATGMVVGTGEHTELGKISHLIETATKLETPLTRKLGQFSLGLSWVIIALAVLTYGIGLLRGQSPVDTFLAAVALAVAAIPEGLPAAVTIILAIGVTRMARRNAIIRKLPAVETLGSTSVICSDKTGTLTKNEMTVVALHAAGARYTFTGTGYAPDGALLRGEEAVRADDSRALRECLTAGVLCNHSRLVEADGFWRIEGDPTEGALLTAAAKAGIDPGLLRDDIPNVDTIPFESERQYMATLHRHPEDGQVIYLKGAVEKVLGLCETAMGGDGSAVPLDREAVHARADALAAEGLRVLAFAMKAARAEQPTLHQDDVTSDLIFLGLQGMIDPPRPEAIDAVRVCRAAGIAVKMITGDHALTARAIAGQLHIGGENPVVMAGAQLAEVSEEDLPAIAAATDVFARVAPEQKLRLVRALQAQRAVVAMTGDGVNDAPALKQADIGIAMGITGTEASKDAADMILTDDNFASIEAAVEEGRGVYDNLRKFITWTLPTNGGEGLLIITAIALGITIPILPVQLLWINMTTALALGLMLAFEPKESGLMRRPARDPNEPVLTPDLLIRTIYVSVLMVIGAYTLYQWELNNGVNEAVARTIVTNVVVLVETAYLFNSRSLCQPVWKLGFLSNRWTLFGALLMIVLQLTFVYTPFMQLLFGTAAVSAVSWLEAALIALAIFAIVEVEKWLRRRVAARCYR